MLRSPKAIDHPLAAHPVDETRLAAHHRSRSSSVHAGPRAVAPGVARMVHGLATVGGHAHRQRVLPAAPAGPPAAAMTLAADPVGAIGTIGAMAPPMGYLTPAGLPPGPKKTVLSAFHDGLPKSRSKSRDFPLRSKPMTAGDGGFPRVGRPLAVAGPQLQRQVQVPNRLVSIVVPARERGTPPEQQQQQQQQQQEAGVVAGVDGLRAPQRRPPEPPLDEDLDSDWGNPYGPERREF
eukprot:GAFH01001749.1.p1 GENE.GAFH01001749.1~~GAFH01001749.1.p1  ORF type:complete len:236 (+),score=31.59 GAFH01001749.1:170-877(+)